MCVCACVCFVQNLSISPVLVLFCLVVKYFLFVLQLLWFCVCVCVLYLVLSILFFLLLFLQWQFEIADSFIRIFSSSCFVNCDHPMLSSSVIVVVQHSMSLYVVTLFTFETRFDSNHNRPNGYIFPFVGFFCALVYQTVSPLESQNYFVVTIISEQKISSLCSVSHVFCSFQRN